MDSRKIKGMDEKIQQIRKIAEQLKTEATGIQAVERNLDRILANVKMLELNISDVRELL